MWRAAVLAAIAGAWLAAPWSPSLAPSLAQTGDLRIDNVSAARKVEATRLTPGTIEFSDHTGPGTTSETALMAFDDWASRQPIEKKFLALFPHYVEPVIGSEDSAADPAQKPYTEKLYVYVA